MEHKNGALAAAGKMFTTHVLGKDMHLTVGRVERSALHAATSHFYHDKH